LVEQSFRKAKVVGSIPAAGLFLFNMNKKKLSLLLTSLLIPQAVGILAGLATSSSVRTWYVQLTKPSFNPPAWLFMPAWTLLYFLMGLALYLVWTSQNENKKQALHIFAIQLAFNFLWSFLFFFLRLPLFAFIELVILWLLIWLNIFKFYCIKTDAGLLLIPYLLWTTFAGVLNFALWWLNK
jgi:translocator protein